MHYILCEPVVSGNVSLNFLQHMTRYSTPICLGIYASCLTERFIRTTIGVAVSTDTSDVLVSVGQTHTGVT